MEGPDYEEGIKSLEIQESEHNKNSTELKEIPRRNTLIVTFAESEEDTDTAMNDEENYGSAKKVFRLVDGKYQFVGVNEKKKSSKEGKQETKSMETKTIRREDSKQDAKAKRKSPIETIEELLDKLYEEQIISATLQERCLKLEIELAQLQTKVRTIELSEDEATQVFDAEVEELKQHVDEELTKMKLKNQEMEELYKRSTPSD